MGNGNSSSSENKKGKHTPTKESSLERREVNENPNGQNAKPNGLSPSRMIRSPSGADIQDQSTIQFVPVEKLSKQLVKKTEHEYSISGIVSDILVKYVFPNYPDLGHKLFLYFHWQSKAKTEHLGATAFRQQCERFLGILDDHVILESYIKMFCNNPENDQCNVEGVKSLLRTCFHLAMSHYSPGVGTCIHLEKTLDSVIHSCFFQEPLTVGFVARWLEQNCARLVAPVHRYVVHTLSTTYRRFERDVKESTGCGLELATPILESKATFNESQALLSISVAWLLAGALPSIYSRPQSTSNVQTAGKEEDKKTINNLTNLTDVKESTSGGVLASQAFMSKMLSVVPSHWTLLYDTMQHGVGANRFLHHVLGYRGPTIIIIEAKSSDNSEMIFCIASPTEWRETHLYVGGEESCLIQLQPKFQLMEKGAKILYLNTSIRGYPKGLRVSVDPRNPIIAVDEHFERLDVHSITHKLMNIEVWGCGDQFSREIQLDIKKWQVKEAERQRTVKLSAADWMDHPDRFLLELGGRPQYNNSKQ